MSGKAPMSWVKKVRVSSTARLCAHRANIIAAWGQVMLPAAHSSVCDTGNSLYYCMYCVRSPLPWVLYFCDHRCCAHPDIYSDWVQSCWTEGISFQLCCHADAARVPLAGGSKVLEEDRSCGAQTRLKTVSSNWGRGAELTVPILWWASARDRAELCALQEQHPILYCHGELQVRVWLDRFFKEFFCVEFGGFTKHLSRKYKVVKIGQN